MEQEQTNTSEIRSYQSQTKNLATLLLSAHDALERFDSEAAGIFLSEAAENFPDNEKALFEYGYFLYEKGELKEAEVLLKKAVQVSPDKNAKKYFALAQLTSDISKSHSSYIKGLQIVIAKLELFANNQQVNNEAEEKIGNLKRLAAQGFCGMAQLEIRKAEACFESFNGNQFLSYIQQSIQIDPYYLEAYSQLSVYYFNMENETSCRKTIAELVACVRELESQNDEDLGEYDPEFFVPIVRMMIEGCIFEDGAYLMEIGLQNNSKDLEANYMYAFCLFKIDELEQADDICQEMEKLLILKSGDDELIQGFLELREEISTALSSMQKIPRDEVAESDDDLSDEQI
jgi:tetratricopeptide (TPR) repeat protein